LPTQIRLLREHLDAGRASELIARAREQDSLRADNVCGQ